MKDTIRCMVVDDEPLAIDLIKSHIDQIQQLTVVHSTNNPIEALRLLKEQNVDLLFLDIQMPLLTGLELLKTLSHPPGVIFTTAYREFAVESYELKVIDYLVKPITFARFYQAVNKFFELNTILNDTVIKEEQSEKHYLFVNVNKKYVKVVFDDIVYVESVKDYIHIHTLNDKIITKDKISDFENKLPDGFLRIHRSFIVNKSRITAFTSQDIEIEEKELPIGNSYKGDVMSALK